MRKCKECGSSKSMVQTVSGVRWERYRVCYECQPEMSSDMVGQFARRALEPDDGDLNYHQAKKEEIAEELESA